MRGVAGQVAGANVRQSKINLPKINLEQVPALPSH